MFDMQAQLGCCTFQTELFEFRIRFVMKTADKHDPSGTVKDTAELVAGLAYQESLSSPLLDKLCCQGDGNIPFSG